MNARLWSQSISEQTAAAESVKATAERLVLQTRDQIERSEPQLRAWVTLSPNIATEATLLDRTDEIGRAHV